MEEENKNDSGLEEVMEQPDIRSATYSKEPPLQEEEVPLEKRPVHFMSSTLE